MQTGNCQVIKSELHRAERVIIRYRRQCSMMVIAPLGVNADRFRGVWWFFVWRCVVVWSMWWLNVSLDWVFKESFQCLEIWGEGKFLIGSVLIWYNDVHSAIIFQWLLYYVSCMQLFIWEDYLIIDSLKILVICQEILTFLFFFINKNELDKNKKVYIPFSYRKYIPVWKM